MTVHTQKKDWKQNDFRLNRRGKPFLVKDDKPSVHPKEDKPKEKIDKPRKQKFEIIRREEMNQLDVTYCALKIKRLNPEAELPMKGTAGSAGYDIIACLDKDVIIGPGEVGMIHTGFATSFRREFVGLIYSRSGMATKRGLVIAQGVAVIDSDYRGEWIIPLRNTSKENQLVRSGDRIAQLLIQPVSRIKMIETDDLNQTARGSGGFGSTGGYESGAQNE